jgi:hypothetical protein
MIPSPQRILASAIKRIQLNTDHQPKEHPPTSILTVVACIFGVVIVCTESMPTQLHGVSRNINLGERQLVDKPD